MATIDKLKKAIDDSGMTMVTIAKRSGIERPTLYNRLRGVGDFTATEINGLTKALRLTREQREDIFFN